VLVAGDVALARLKKSLVVPKHWVAHVVISAIGVGLASGGPKLCPNKFQSAAATGESAFAGWAYLAKQ